MFHYISGPVAELGPNLAVIDCGGLGFQVNTSAYTLAGLQAGAKVKLFTYVHIREELFEIYGFLSRAEKRCFELLLGVSGVGPKAALAILSTGSPEEVIFSIVSGDEKAIMAAQGVGKKIAQRIILELKDKLASETSSISLPGGKSAPVLPRGGGNRDDVAAALTVLGYASAEINAALKGIDLDHISVEDGVKAALRAMMTK